MWSLNSSPVRFACGQAENEAKQKLREEQARLREEVRKREEEKAKILKTLDAEAQITACPDVKVDLSKGKLSPFPRTGAKGGRCRVPC